MNDFQTLMSLVVDSVVQPRPTARRLILANCSDGTRMMGLALVVVLTTLLSSLAMMMIPPEARVEMGLIGANPLGTAVVQGVVMMITVFAVHFLGRLAGGTGLLRDALLLIVWLQVILVLLQAAQLVLQIVLPSLAALLGLGSIGVMFWLLSNFVAELHGFRSVLLTFFGVLGGLLMLGILLVATIGPAMLGVPT